MFLAPLFLIAAGIGACIPLVLHLMQSRKRVRLPFPTLRFLQLAEKHASRRIRLENLVLWLLRTLIMALLGLAFATPMIRRGGLDWLGEAPRDVALILDASYSMGYHSERGTVWDKSIEAAVAVLEGLRDTDRFCIYLAREQPEPLVAEPVADRQDGIARLRALQPGTGSSRLGPAVNAALKALFKADPNREHELHIFTDNQALPWQGFSLNSPKLDSKTGVFVSMFGVPAPENAGVSSVELQPALVRKGAEVRVLTRLHRTGPAADTTLSLYISDRETGRRVVSATDPDSAAPSFPLPALDVGVHAARIQTPDDNLPVDNAFYFLIRVQEPMPVLVVGGEEETLFLRTALRTGLGRPNALETVAPEQISEKTLSRYSSVILCNALPLFGQAITLIENYVKAGGVLLLFPGVNAKPAAYAPWTALPAVPKAIEELPLAQRNRTLTWQLPQHPLVRPLREGIGIPALVIRRRLTFDSAHDATQRLVAMGANQPFLLQRQFGSGFVLLFAVSADRTWSDFPLSPFFLPLLLQCADYGAGVGAKAPFEFTTDALSLSERFPEMKAAPSMSAPDGQPVSIRSALVDGRTTLVAENLLQAGFYSLADAAHPEGKPALAVNLPREESDLTPLPANDVPRILGVERALVASDLPTLRKFIEEHRVGRTFGEQLLWVALVLIAAEFALANFLASPGKGGGNRDTSPRPGAAGSGAAAGAAVGNA